MDDLRAGTDPVAVVRPPGTARRTLTAGPSACAGTAAYIERAVDESFVAGFRTVMVVCIGLALVSALAAALLVEDRREQVAGREPYPSG